MNFSKALKILLSGGIVSNKNQKAGLMLDTYLCLEGGVIRFKRTLCGTSGEYSPVNFSSAVLSDGWVEVKKIVVIVHKSDRESFFRASTSSFFDCVTLGKTPEAALDDLRIEVERRIAQGESPAETIEMAICLPEKID